MDLHSFAAKTFGPGLTSLQGVLDKGLAHAQAQGVTEAELVEARLAPDMFPLAVQVRVVCDQVRYGIARLVGEEPPEVAEAEVDDSFEGFRRRIARTVAYVESVDADRYAGAETREVRFEVMPGLRAELTGAEFLRDWAMPNFYFHVTTAYAILRSRGAPIGKADYMAHVGYALKRDA